MKPLLNIDDLIKHMINKGITFNVYTTNEARKFLEDRNYYMKLASYRTNYKKIKDGKNAGKYIGLDFAYLRELSTLDMKLRYIIFQMALDIEHYMKVKLIREIENNPEEDGYKIIQKFLSEKDKKFRVLNTIQKHKSSSYCKDLIEKYYPYFPVWVFVEVISFGDFAFLCDYYYELYDVEIGNRIMLNSVRDLRNACAHSNCLINNLIPGNNTPHQIIIDKVKLVKSISKNSRDKKLRNKCIYDFICLLYAYDEIVSSSETKKKRFSELKGLFDNRFIEHKDWFSNNNLITSSYSFAKNILDDLYYKC